MSELKTIKDLVDAVENSSTTFEKTNTDLKRRFLKWNIEAFNIIASAVSVGIGSFGTGYPFYVLDENLNGKIPIISEQIRYNRQLVRDGEPIQKSIWQCKSCLERNYDLMPDLKTICKPCPNMINELKPRKIINRLPDLDMWLVCEDGQIEQAQVEMSELLREYNMNTSDVAPLQSLNDIVKIATSLKNGEFPRVFLPIDAHIIEESRLRELIVQVPEELQSARREERKPYLPIRPKSLRKVWQYDDEAYNFIYDYLSAFTAFNFSEEMSLMLQRSRTAIIQENTPEELFDFLIQSATPANFRRFQEHELEEIFYKRIASWANQAKIAENEKESEDEIIL